jgi:hypothetical protein
MKHRALKGRWLHGRDIGTDKELREIFFGEGSEPITENLIEELAGEGWDRIVLLDARKGGAVYNRKRNSILFPPKMF